MSNTQKNKTNLFKRVTTFLEDVVHVISYMFFIFYYFVNSAVLSISKKLKFLKPISESIRKLGKIWTKKDGKDVPSHELIYLAVKNMTSKTSRLVVTVGGVTLGISAIVFFVSIGYGLQSLVIDRVSRLEELRQADVSIVPGSNLVINDKTINDFQSIDKVKNTLPQISVVGKVSFNESMTDVAVYGVTSDYLEASAISPTKGKIFDSNTLEATVEVEKETTVEEQEDVPLSDEFLTEDWVEVEGESQEQESLVVTQVTFPDDLEGAHAVVNKSFLSILGLNEEEALGKVFEVSFVSTDKALLDDQNKIESNAVEYEIVGITPDDVIPLFYVPISHVKSMGIQNYSQVKVSVNEESNLTTVRSAIESLGYSTASVADTVNQINDLFSKVRIVLAIFGVIGLFIASLGMFNTLTVSLLERTREIGLLKAMGMKSKEVRDLFLAESMIMGIAGGVLGLLIGFGFGKILEVGLSIYSASRGAGTLTIVDVPLLFVLFVIILSFGVGVFTGLYPSRRATKISALNALRYE